METLLAVPIVCKSPFQGNLYVADRLDGREFTTQDEQVLVRFASKAASAIDSAHLHQRLKGLAVAEERARIAREMHDGMAQVLAYVNTKAQAVKEFLRHQRVEEASAQLEQLAAAAREIYTDVREGILALQTQASPERTLPQALEQFIHAWQDHSGIRGELHIEGEPRFRPDVELQLLRIIQEALTNVRKHAGATRATVDIRADDGGLEVEIEDDGGGFDPAAVPRGSLPRFGLAIMRERAESIGGTLALDAAPGRGTRVVVHVPTGAEAPIELS
jgi:signal transduction histidine kinase